MTQALDLKSFGAVPDQKTDNAAKINYAFQVAAAQGQPLRFGAGPWAYGDILSAIGVEIQCEPGATLYALNPARSALFLGGTGASVRGFTFDGVKPPGRLTTRESCRVIAFNAQSFAIGQNIVKTCAGAGLRADASFNGFIGGNRVAGTLADSIHITDGSHHIVVGGLRDEERNVIEASGDDGIAVVSYRDQPLICRAIQAIGNKVTNNVGGRCMSVVGGQDVFYAQNEMVGNAQRAGLYFSAEHNKDWTSYGLTNVAAKRNTIRNCGNPAKDHPAVLIFSDGAMPNDTILIERHNIVQDVPNVGGIRVFGPCTNVLLDSNLIQATPPLRLDTPGVVVIPFTGGAVGVA